MNNLRTLRHQRRLTQEEAAAALGTTLSQYTKLEYGLRRLSDKWISRAAQAFGVDDGDIVSDGRQVVVPIVGYIGPGAGVERCSPNGGGRGVVGVRRSIKPTAVALEIRADCLGASFAGWFVVFDDDHRPVPKSLSGSVCIVGLDDGRSFVRRLIPSRLSRSIYHLHAQVGDPIMDVRVSWATPMLALVQPSLATACLQD